MPTVLTISRQIGSGGTYIGQTVARRLGLRYLDREILQQAAKMLGVEDAAVDALEERLEGFWSRVALGLFAGAPDAPFVPPPPPGVSEGHVFEAEKQIIRDIASRENVVIVGRGAPHLLRDQPGVMRVFVHAPEPWRVTQIQQAYGMTDVAARDLVQQSDRRRAKFVQGLIGRSWTDACLYDLTVDTAVVGLDAASDFVTRVVQAQLKDRPPARGAS